MAEAQPTERIDYHAYLRSPGWALKRKAALARAENRCQLCNTDKYLQVHHRTYERVGREKPADLTVLCRGCHAKFHDIGKPKKPKAPAARRGKRAGKAPGAPWKVGCILSIKEEMALLDVDGRFETSDMFARVGGEKYTYKQIKIALKSMEGRGEVVRLGQRGWRRPESRLLVV